MRVSNFNKGICTWKVMNLKRLVWDINASVVALNRCCLSNIGRKTRHLLLRVFLKAPL